MKRQVVWLFGHTTGPAFVLVVCALGKTAGRFDPQTSSLHASAHNFLKLYFGPQNFIPRFNCAPPSFLISCKLTNLFNLVLFIKLNQINSIKPLLISFSN